MKVYVAIVCYDNCDPRAWVYATREEAENRIKREFAEMSKDDSLHHLSETNIVETEVGK